MSSLQDISRGRYLSIIAVGLCLITTGVASITLERSLTGGVASPPPRPSPGSGLSLLALLMLLLNSILSLLGISPSGGSGEFSGGSLLQLLFGVVGVVYQHRLELISGVIILTVLGLAITHRQRIAVPSFFADSDGSTDSVEAVSTDEWPPATPDNVISRAWLKLTTAIEVDDPVAKTPGEWQTAAIEAGLDPVAVRTITRTFEAVSYGETPATAEQRKRVKAALSELTQTEESSE